MATTTINGIKVEYAEQGAGETVVLLHCTGSSFSQWRKLAEALSGRFHVIAPDLYGYGGTGDWGGQGPISLAQEAELVMRLVEGCGRFHLVGHSFGGAVALHIAQRWPQRLRSLTVFEPAAFHLLCEGDMVDMRALKEISGVADALGRALTRGDRWGGCAQFIDYWCGEGAWAGTPEAKRAALAGRLGKIVLDFWSTLSDPGRLCDLASCAVPALVMRGGRSPLPGRRIAQHLARALRCDRLVEIEAASHMAPVTHADEVNLHIAAHIEAHAAGAVGRSPAVDLHPPMPVAALG